MRSAETPTVWLTPEMIERLAAGRLSSTAWSHLMSPVATDKFTVPLYATPPAEVKGEPVAWRYRTKGSSTWWGVAEKDPARWHDREVYEIEPLYATPPADSGGLREALQLLYDAFLSRHGCFPLDRVTAEQKQWNDAMLKADAALNGEPNARG